jgi:hypothetical protein
MSNDILFNIIPYFSTKTWAEKKYSAKKGLKHSFRFLITFLWLRTEVREEILKYVFKTSGS